MQPNLHPHGKMANDTWRDQDLERWIGGLKESEGADPEPVLRPV